MNGWGNLHNHQAILSRVEFEDPETCSGIAGAIKA
jgi:hypothetical protein